MDDAMRAGWLARSPATDQFEDDAEKAATNDTAFARFRILPGIRNIVECRRRDKEDRWQRLACFSANADQILATAVRLNDIGFPEGEPLSGAMQRYAYSALLIDGLFYSEDSPEHIVEIGGGYGGQAAILAALYPGCRLSMFDLPSACRLQARYLQAAGVERNRFRMYDRLPDKPIHCDLVVAASSLSELNGETRAVYGEHVLSHAYSGWIFWNCPARRMAGWLDSPAQAIQWLRQYVPHSASLADGHMPSSVFEYPEWTFIWDW
jgi:hypothetical protein